MIFNNKMINKLAYDVLICNSELKTKSPYIYQWVKNHCDIVYYSYGIWPIIRFIKICVMLNNIIAYGLGYIDLITLNNIFDKFQQQDKNYWYGGIYTEIINLYSDHNNRALRYHRLLTK